MHRSTLLHRVGAKVITEEEEEEEEEERERERDSELYSSHIASYA